MDYSILPEHMQEGMRLYIEEGVEPGSFLRAVLENNLMEALGRADHVNRDSLFDYGNFLYNEAPPPCYGSAEKVSAWLRVFEEKRKEKL